MCLDKVWEAWGDAWMNKKPFKATSVGIAYMLAGDTGASNTDPYATAGTPTNQWVVEGPHLMVIEPDAAQLEGLSTDPHKRRSLCDVEGYTICPHHGAGG